MVIVFVAFQIQWRKCIAIFTVFTNWSYSDGDQNIPGCDIMDCINYIAQQMGSQSHVNYFGLLDFW